MEGCRRQYQAVQIYPMEMCWFCQGELQIPESMMSTPWSYVVLALVLNIDCIAIAISDMFVKSYWYAQDLPVSISRVLSACAKSRRMDGWTLTLAAWASISLVRRFDDQNVPNDLACSEAFDEMHTKLHVLWRISDEHR